VLSHWPHVRQLVAELVRQHVASVKALRSAAKSAVGRLQQLTVEY